MCAIAGVFHIDTQEVTIEKMLETMTRRGPDATGVCHTEEGHLLHARLAVIDPDGGRQPIQGLSLSFDASVQRKKKLDLFFHPRLVWKTLWI